MAYSTSVANAFNFALFADYPETDKPNEWKIKFIACVIVVAVAALHYRKVNLGILANNTLALYKVLFLTILTFAGFIVTCIDGAHGQLQGLNDYATTKVEHVTPTNVVLALLMVLFSYDGWENASKLLPSGFLGLTLLKSGVRLCHIGDRWQCRGKKADFEERCSHSDQRGHCSLYLVQYLSGR